MRNIVSPLDGFLSPFGRRSGVIDPFASLMSTLLSGSTQLIAHPLEYGSMFQDRAGTTPVTAPGQLVGMVLDHGVTGSAPVPGPELVTNGTFDTDTFWTKGTGVTISGGVATATSLAAFSDFVRNDTATYTTGTFYEVSVDITAYTSGTIGFLWPVTTSFFSGVGTYKFIVAAIDSRIRLRAGDAFTGTIDNISIRELPGYHATAISDAARGVYAVVPATGRRNLLTYTEEFDNAAWIKLNATINAAGELTDTAADAQHYIRHNITKPASAIQYSSFFDVKAGSRNFIYLQAQEGGSFCRQYFNVSTGAVGTGQSSGLTLNSADVEDIGDGFYRCKITFTSGTGTTLRLLCVTADADNDAAYAGAGDVAITIHKSQLEEGSTATAYQRVVSEFDVTEAGVPSLSYISYNGVNTAYSTPALSAPLVNKAQVFAGVRKLSDAAQGIMSEFSPSIATNNGAFALSAPNSAADNLAFESKGTTLQSAISSGYASPITNVITGLGDISGDTATLRIDGTQVGQSTADQGTGDYNPSGTYPIYYGARGGTSAFFNGRSYDTLGPITRFSAANATTAQIEAAEAYYTARVI